ncbi:MAG: hypothetical protein HY268_05735 [Deltaproteobacteria bacterium]|nr:hypothetical protein [Deltaproteobacteria bacterium]
MSQHSSPRLARAAKTGAYIGAAAYLVTHIIPLIGYKNVLDWMHLSVMAALNITPNKIAGSPENIMGAAIYVLGWGVFAALGAAVGALVGSRTSASPTEIESSALGLDLVTWDQFIPSAMAQGCARSEVPISKIPDIFDQISATRKAKGLKGSQITALLRHSLLGVCPQCGSSSAAAGLQIIWTNRNVGGNVTLTGNTGGTERWFRGLCRNYSCSSKDIMLFWCPDKDQKSKSYLKGAGIELDDTASVQRARIHASFA